MWQIKDGKMPDKYDHWFRETEEGKQPDPDSPAAPENKPGGFVAQNIDSFQEFLRERYKR